MCNRPLFHIAADLLALADLLADVGGDVTDADAEAAIAAWFTELGSERNTKLDHYAALITDLQARATAREEEANRLRRLASVDRNTADRLRQRLYDFFKTQGLTRLSTERYELAIVRNGGQQKIAYTEEPDQVPPAYRQLSYTYNTQVVRTILEAGQGLTFAHLLPRGERFSIR